MAGLDELTPNYRRAKHRWASAPSLGKHYVALARCFTHGGYGLVEHVKSFIESVCVTILLELRQPMPSSMPTTTDLLVAALGPLGLRNTKGASRLDKVLSGFNRISDALADMRNESGPVAHGKDGFLDGVTSDHARAFLAVGDAILGVLLNALEGKEPDLSATREPYENFPHLNERIDRAVTVEARVDEEGERQIVVFSVATGPRGEAIELRVEPSRLLYGIDREVYIEVLRAADLVVAEVGVEGEKPEVEVETGKPVEVSWAAAQGGPLTALVTKYAGVLDPFRSGLKGFLTAEAQQPEKVDEAGNRLLDSMLATAEQNVGLDWVEREPIRARLKVACKRVLVHFKVDAGSAEEIAGRFVAWLRVQVGSEAVTSSVSAAAGKGSAS